MNSMPNDSYLAAKLDLARVQADACQRGDLMTAEGQARIRAAQAAVAAARPEPQVPERETHPLDGAIQVAKLAERDAREQLAQARRLRGEVQRQAQNELDDVQSPIGALGGLRLQIGRAAERLAQADEAVQVALEAWRDRTATLQALYDDRRRQQREAAIEAIRVADQERAQRREEARRERARQFMERNSGGGLSGLKNRAQAAGQRAIRALAGRA